MTVTRDFKYKKISLQTLVRLLMKKNKNLSGSDQKFILFVKITIYVICEGGLNSGMV